MYTILFLGVFHQFNNNIWLNVTCMLQNDNVAIVLAGKSISVKNNMFLSLLFFK